MHLHYGYNLHARDSLRDDASLFAFMCRSGFVCRNRSARSMSLKYFCCAVLFMQFSATYHVKTMAVATIEEHACWVLVSVLEEEVVLIAK